MRNEREKAIELYGKIGELIIDYTAKEVCNALCWGLGVTLGHQQKEDQDSLLQNCIESIKFSCASFQTNRGTCRHGEGQK